MGDCENRCYEIGGPWISFDPDCPVHGYDAQRRERDAESTIATLRAELAEARGREAGLRASCEHLQRSYDSYVVACELAESRLARVAAVQRYDVQASHALGINYEVAEPTGRYFRASEVLAESGSGGGGEPAGLIVTDEMRCAGFESDAWDKLSDAVMEAGGNWPYSCREAAECVEGIYRAMHAARKPAAPLSRRME